MTNKRNPVGWFEIYVQDMERARAFYEKTLDVQLCLLEKCWPSRLNQTILAVEGLW